MTLAQAARRDIREKRHTGTTRGLAMGYVQCNLAVVPRADAFDFLLYCQRNHRACPVLEVCDPGIRNPGGSRRAPTCARTCRATRSTAPASGSTTLPTSTRCGGTISSLS